MELIRQDGFPDCCQQACIAMVSGKTLEEVIKMVGHSRRMGIGERNGILDSLGIKREIGKHGGEFLASGWNNIPQLKGTHLCSVYSFIDKDYAHAVVLHDGVLYDPWHGINPDWPWHRRIMTYTTISPRTY